MSLLYTFYEFDKPVNHIEFQVLGFFLLSGGHKTLIPEDTKLVLLLTTDLLHPPPWNILKDTNTNAKEQQVYPSVSIHTESIIIVSLLKNTIEVQSKS